MLIHSIHRQAEMLGTPYDGELCCSALGLSPGLGLVYIYIQRLNVLRCHTP